MESRNLALRVKELRKRNGLSQDELAKKSGLSLRTIQRIENGETEPTGETLKRISNAFNLTPEELIDFANGEDKFKITIAAKNENIHIFADKLIISKTNKFTDSVGEYGESVNNVFKSLIVFFVFIPIFTILSAILYKTHPDLSFNAGAFAFFFILMAIYIMLFTSGIPIIYKSQIKSIGMQNSIFGNAIVIKYGDMGRLKRRSLIIAKDKIEFFKETLLKEGILDCADFKSDSKVIGFEGGIVFISFFIVFFTKNLLDNTFLDGMWVNGFIFSALCGFILFLITKGLIESYIWRKKQHTVINVDTK